MDFQKPLCTIISYLPYHLYSFAAEVSVPEGVNSRVFPFVWRRVPSNTAGFPRTQYPAALHTFN